MKNRHHPFWDNQNRRHQPVMHHRRVWHQDKERFLYRSFFGPILSIFFVVILGILLVWLFFSELPGKNLILTVVGTFFVLMLLGAISFIARTVKRVTSPFVEVMSAADLVAKGDFSVRVSEHYSGEFKKLAESFNCMVIELEEAEERRRRLTADVAHELRTPLHILQGNLEGMQDGIYTADDEQIRLLLEETKILSRLVDDLQTLTLAENKQLPLNCEEINIGDLLSEVAAGFTNQVESLGLELCVLSPPDQVIIHGDRERLGQVLRNLVANGMRFTPPGGRIMISSTEEEGRILIQISDTGAGIPEEDLPHVFDRFWKGDQSRARQEGIGSGLGLSIAKGIVEMHQGEISVDSQLDQGTTFSIRLPMDDHDPCIK